MKFREKIPPRRFSVKEITLSHMADIHLEADELVTFTPAQKLGVSKTEDGNLELDITAKDWGYYLGGSTNGRMADAGFVTILAKNPENRLYILAYDKTKKASFDQYLKDQNMEIVIHLDQMPAR